MIDGLEREEQTCLWLFLRLHVLCPWSLVPYTLKVGQKIEPPLNLLSRVLCLKP